MGVLDGRRILITGAARGLGLGIAERFDEEGAKLALLDYNEPELQSAARKIGALACCCDISDVDEVNESIATAIELLGGLDGVVNAAGVVVARSFEETTADDWNRVLGINLLGPVNVVRAALPALKAAGNATVVNVASVTGYQPTVMSSAYSASKAGLMMFTKSVAMEFGPGIRANTICPGLIKTEMSRYVWEDPAMLERVTQGYALKRIGVPEDIANAAVYLSSDQSSYVTGTEISVDGGWLWR